MKIIVAVDGSTQALLGARWVAELPLTEADEVMVASVAERPVILGAWGYAYTQATGTLLDAAWTVCLPTYREGLPTALTEITQRAPSCLSPWMFAR